MKRLLIIAVALAAVGCTAQQRQIIDQVTPDVDQPATTTTPLRPDGAIPLQFNKDTPDYAATCPIGVAWTDGAYAVCYTEPAPTETTTNPPK